jgi:hypothetical protein
MCAETNPGISWGSSSGDDFQVGRDSLSVMISESTGPCARAKPSFSWGSSFGENFQGGSDSVFGDDYRVKGNVRRDKSGDQLGKQFWW